MPKRWTTKEEGVKRNEVYDLYVIQNLSLGEVSKVLSISHGSVYKRLLRFKIKINPHLKKGYKNFKDVPLPRLSTNLAECIGILLGDGHISKEQIFITLGKKEKSYATYVQYLFEKVFKIRPKVFLRKGDNLALYFNSMKILRFLKKMGLVSNKVKDQVAIPTWVFRNKSFGSAFLRGFFDTDGSAYKLKFGFQLSFCNRSKPLLEGSRDILLNLGYSPSRISIKNLYLTRKDDLMKFLHRIKPANNYKYRRLENYLKGADTQVVNEGAL